MSEGDRERFPDYPSKQSVIHQADRQERPNRETSFPEAICGLTRDLQTMGCGGGGGGGSGGGVPWQ